MGLGRLGERIGLAHGDADRAGADQVEQGAGTLPQVGRVGDVVGDGRAG